MIGFKYNDNSQGKLYYLCPYYVSFVCFNGHASKRDSGFAHERHYYLDPQVDPKIAKRHFFQDIQNSFQWATGIGLEPHQKNFRKKISTNTVARAVQNFGRNGPLLAG